MIFDKIVILTQNKVTKLSNNKLHDKVVLILIKYSLIMGPLYLNPVAFQVTFLISVFQTNQNLQYVSHSTHLPE